MEPIILWLWRVRKPAERGWRELGWRMTEEQAKAWAAKNGYEMDRVPGSAEVPKSVAG